MSDPTWLTLALASKRISVSVDRLKEAINATDHTFLPAVKNGNKWLVRAVDVDAWPEKAFPHA